MQRHMDTGTVTVPVPDHRELAIGTLLDHSTKRSASE